VKEDNGKKKGVEIRWGKKYGSGQREGEKGPREKREHSLKERGEFYESFFGERVSKAGISGLGRKMTR